MNFTNRVYVELRVYFEFILQLIVNSSRFFGLGPKKFTNFPKSLRGKVVIITGSNTGIGKVNARVLAQLNAKVIMACRDSTKAHIAANDIKQEFKEADLVVKKLDLSSLASVRQFAKEVNQEEFKIDYLINNAGVMCCPKMQTEDGFEMQFGTNHLGHFLLTYLLVDKMKNSPNARIINVSSLAHTNGEIDFNDINLDKSYNKLKSYSQSKLANILFTRELAHRLTETSIRVYCLHPGIIKTDLYRHFNGVLYCLYCLFSKLVFVDPELGAQTTLYCTLEESISGETGRYYKNCHRVDNMVTTAVDDVSARKLWKLSCKLVEIEDNYDF